MTAQDAWLESVESSHSTLDSVAIQSTDALHLSLKGNIPLASIVVKPVPKACETENCVLLHPVLFDFLSQLPQLIKVDGSDEGPGGVERGNETSIGALPIEPLQVSSGSQDSGTQPGWVARRIGVKVLPEGSQVFLTSIFMDIRLAKYIQGETTFQIELFFRTQLLGRLIKSGSILLLSSVHGFAVVQVNRLETSGLDNLTPGSEIAYRVPVNETPWRLVLQLDSIERGQIEEHDGFHESDKYHSTVPGYETLVDEILGIIELGKRPGSPSGILITGCPGVGKSRLASCIAHKYTSTKKGRRVQLLSTQDLIFRAATENDLYRNIILPDLKKCSLCIVDDLHLLEREDEEESPSDVEYNMVQNAISQTMDEYNDKCVIVGIGQVASRLPHALTKVGRFEKQMQMLPPTQLQREQIWEYLLLDSVTESATLGSWSTAMASTTAGCVAGDLIGLYHDAWTRSRARSREKSPAALEWGDLREASRSCVPSQLSELDVSKPTIYPHTLSWADVHRDSWNGLAGYSSVKKHLFRQVVVPWRQFLRGMDTSADATASWLTPPAGVLFHGPSGCGKTAAAKCLANSLELPMIQVRATDILDKWLGGSEASLRSLFARARAASPCILFLDEIDSIANNRAEDDSNDFTSRILSTLLNEMDGVSSSIQRSRMLVVACTNRWQALDAALVRPGRFEEHFLLDSPSIEDLVQILELRLERVPISDDVSIPDIARTLFERKATGADVEGLCRDVSLSALRGADSVDGLVVGRLEFEEGLETLVEK